MEHAEQLLLSRTRDVLGVPGLVVEALEVQEVLLVHIELQHHRTAARQLLAAGHDAGIARYSGRIQLILICATCPASMVTIAEILQDLSKNWQHGSMYVMSEDCTEVLSPHQRSGNSL